MSADRWPDRYPGDGPATGRELVSVAGEWNAAELRMQVESAARTRRAPYVIAAVTAGVGVSGWGIAQIAAAVGGERAWSFVCAVVWAATALAVPVLRRVFRARIPARWSRTWWVATAAAALWVDVVVAQGANLLHPGTAIGVLATLILGGAVLGASWADEHQVPQPAEAPADEPTVELPTPPAKAPSEADTIERDWDDEVAHGKNPIAPDSVLDQRTALPHGWRWLVRLDRGGSVGCSELEQDGVSARVALKLGERPTHVILERLDGPEDREHLAQLTVVTRDVLATGVRYRGPRYADGLIPIGDYADGTGEVMWTAYDGTGVKSGLVVGEQGSGKSALMAGLGLAYRGSGEWTVLFGDGDEQGGSSRLLGEVAHDFARGPAEILEQLQGVEAFGRFRGDLMGTLTAGRDGKPTPIVTPGQRPVDKILPCRQFHGLIWFLDEFHRLANDPWLQSQDFVPRLARAVRLLRKYGGAFVLGTQSALGDDFDGDSAFRAMIAGGNTITLRSKNKSEQGLITDGLNPAALPKGGGYGLQGDGPRRVMIRVAYSPDMDRWVPQVQRHGHGDERSWAAFRRYRTVRELDPVVDYSEKLAALAAFDEAIATGAPLPGSPEAASADEVLPVEGLSVAGLGVPTLAPVIPIRRDDTPSVPDTTGLPVKARRVHEALTSRDGAWRTAELVEECAMTAPDVSKALKVLVERGLAHRPLGVRGVYEAGPGEGHERRGAV